VKTGGRDFATRLSAPPAVVGEKFEVTTPHQVEPGTDQPDGAVAEVVCLPRNARRHPARPEEPSRNRSIGFVGEACIKRAEDEHQSLTPRGR
jgi:hypothetical protein